MLSSTNVPLLGQIADLAADAPCDDLMAGAVRALAVCVSLADLQARLEHADSAAEVLPALAGFQALRDLTGRAVGYPGSVDALLAPARGGSKVRRLGREYWSAAAALEGVESQLWRRVNGIPAVGHIAGRFRCRAATGFEATGVAWPSPADKDLWSLGASYIVAFLVRSMVRAAVVGPLPPAELRARDLVPARHAFGTGFAELLGSTVAKTVLTVGGAILALESGDGGEWHRACRDQIGTLPGGGAPTAGDRRALLRLLERADPCGLYRELCSEFGLATKDAALRRGGAVGGPDGPFDGKGFRWANKVCQGLTPQDYRLLSYLWHNGARRRSATFEELREQVWEKAVGDGGIRSAISRLDTKLNEDGIYLGLETANYHVLVQWRVP